MVMVGLVLVAFGDLHPESRAIEALSGHHRRGVASRDADRMQELTRLASAADKQARRASKLRDSEAGKLGAAPESKVDAEEMLAHEAKEKGVALDRDMKDMRGELKRMSKTLRKDHHRARQEGRELHTVEGERRDDMISLHDKEMKVLEARHDVKNAAKDGDVQALRDSQTRLADRKDIAKGARAEYDRKTKLQDQVEARTRLLNKRSKDLEERINRRKAKVHNDDLKAREEYAAALAIGSRADYLRDETALKTARAKYASLAELLDDPSTDHEQVEQTLSKIASNIHSWKNLEAHDETDERAKARLYKKAKQDMRRKSIALSDASTSGDVEGTQSLFETFASAGQKLQSLQQYAYAAPATAYPAPAQALQQSYPPAAPMAPPAAFAQAPVAPAAPVSVVPTGNAQQAPASNPTMLPGAVGNIPYVYDAKQYLPSPAPGAGFPIVWLFADNKTPDALYFGYQSADGVMHVYNEIKPSGVTRQQAFANEYWTILAADKKTVAVQPFKITQENQWLSIGPASGGAPTL